MILQRDPRDPDDAAQRHGSEAEGTRGTPRTPHGVAWTPFDPGDAPELPASVDGAGRVVAMIASTELVGVGWATAVASELARVWAGERPGVVLVDTDLERPRLHHAARVSNAMGLAEVLRGETPVADATRVVEEDRLFCVPAGNALEDPAADFDPTRWGRLCKAFSDAGVTVVAYVPVQAAWIDAVLDTATDVVLLTEQYRRLEWPNRDDAPPLRAVLGPMLLKGPPPDPTGRPGSRSAPLLGFDLPKKSEDLDDLEMLELVPEDGEEGEAGKPAVMEASTASVAPDAEAEAGDALDADASDPEEPARVGEQPEEDPDVLEWVAVEPGTLEQVPEEAHTEERETGALDPHEPDAEEPLAEELVADAAATEGRNPAESPRMADDREVELGGAVTIGTAPRPSPPVEDPVDPRVRHGRRRMAAGLILVAAAVVAWAVTRAGGDPDVAESGELAPEESGAVAPVQAGPAPSTVRPASPSAAFSVGVASYTDAARAEAEASRLRSAFPALSWMVAPAEVAGTVYHRVVGGLLPDSVAAVGVAGELARGGVSEWIVRRSGWVVELGIWETPDQAESQRDAARAAGIPAYLSRIERNDGSLWNAVYAGGYADEEEASHLVDRARDAGFEAHVVPRMGRPPS